MSGINPNVVDQLVCHACGYKLPPGELTNPKLIKCCKKPDIHLHNAAIPCDKCG